MTPTVPPEIAFLADPFRGGVLAAAGVALGVGLWRRLATTDPALRAAAAWMASGMVGLNLLGWASGAWVGPAFEGSTFVTIQVLTAGLGFSMWVPWIAGYRALRARFRHPLRAYAAVALPFIPVVFIVDAWQMQRNQFQMAHGYTIALDALVGQAVMWAPAILYERLARRSG